MTPCQRIESELVDVEAEINRLIREREETMLLPPEIARLESFQRYRDILVAFIAEYDC